jgi:hypothetical protein
MISVNPVHDAPVKLPPRPVLPIAHSGSLPRRPPPLLRIFQSDSLTR